MSLLIVVSSPSGGGKTTSCRGLLQRDPRMRQVITCTTRAPRQGEENGKDYHFFSLNEFEERERRGEFLETAIVFGNRYGSLKKSVEDELAAGHDVLLAIDVQGAESVRRLAKQDQKLGTAYVDVFLMPPSMEVLEKRLAKRGTDSPEVIQRRLAAAREEIGQAPKYQHVITSCSIEEDIDHLQTVVEAERKKRNR